jgi:hypothetical protein
MKVHTCWDSSASQEIAAEGRTDRPLSYLVRLSKIASTTTRSSWVTASAGMIAVGSPIP